MPAGSKFVLRKGDRVVFLGDSITEQHLYTNYVESYLVGRYPELGLSFYNAGWGGDRAPGGVARLARDVLPLKPTVVTLCYGMNDGGYVKPTPQILETFAGGMEELIRRLKARGIRIVLMTPGMAEEASNPSFLGNTNYNHGGLRVLADHVLKLARREKLPVCDTHKLMNDAYVKGKAADPAFSLAPDGIHPNPAGHLVMAYGLLKAMGVPPRRQNIRVDVGKPSVRKTQLGYSLSIRPGFVPFMVEPAARPVLPFLPFQEEFNSLRLAITGLPDDRFRLQLDSDRAGEFSAEEAAKGIELSSAWVSPLARRGQAIHQFTAEKCGLYFKFWRTWGFGGTDFLPSGVTYNKTVHRAGIQAMPALEVIRRTMALVPVAGLGVRLSRAAAQVQLVDNGDFLQTWRMLGTFPRPFEADKLGGEAAFSAGAPAFGDGWVTQDVNTKDPTNNLCELYGQASDCFAYACAVVESPMEQEAELLLGSDDGFAAYLNGELLAANLAAQRPVVTDQDRLPIRLAKGANVLLLKIAQGGGKWGFCARFAGMKEPVGIKL